MCVVVFRLKTAYEMRISDWSSDVCSSDLKIGVDFGIDALAAFHFPRRLFVVVPHLLTDQPRVQATQRFALPRRLDFGLATIAAGLVGSGVVAKPVGNKIGRGAGRERGLQDVYRLWVAVSLQKKKHN